MKYTTDAGTIICPHTINYAEEALQLYTIFNPEKFNNKVYVSPLYYPTVGNIYRAHKQTCELHELQRHYPHLTINNKKVLIAFSGGLDSMYQVLTLKEQGYEIYLYHVANINYYTNGKERKICEQFAQKFNLPLIVSEFKQNTKKDNVNRKYWKENSFKNTLIYSLMLDYCLQNNICYLSSGDDLRLSLDDAVVGTNIADARQITIPFAINVSNFFGLKWLWVDNNIDKAQRLHKLQINGCMDDFYSCVNPGRFNQSNHNRIEQKFNVKLEQWNCGVCRKCAFHSLLRHYYLGEEYNKEFIDFCWEKICIGADFEFFNPKLTLQQRKYNLIHY